LAPLIILSLLGMLVMVGPQATTSSKPPPKQVACINDDAGTCLMTSDALVAFSNGQIVVTYYPVCADAVVSAVVASSDLVFVDGNMAGSQYQGPECVTALMAAKAGNPRPAIIAYSTETQTSRQMVKLGADAEILPTAGVKNIYQLVARLLGMVP
jgi:DNA-binding NarL/FixJ family response regulator